MLRRYDFIAPAVAAFEFAPCFHLQEMCPGETFERWICCVFFSVSVHGGIIPFVQNSSEAWCFIGACEDIITVFVEP